jgi:iron complex transport system ATP-binding protein
VTVLFRLAGATVRYGKRTVLEAATMDFSTGELVAVVGPNGAGKSTLLHIMAGLHSDFVGSCDYKGKPVRTWPRREFAREVSLVPQNTTIEFPFSSEQVVRTGRTPFGDGLFESSDDDAAVQRAMELTDTVPFRSRDFRTLSGGERQRVILAASLAQSDAVLLLDEPTTFLDLGHQIALYRLLRDLCKKGTLAVAVTHDLNLAATYADRIVVLRDGKTLANGHPAEVLTASVIAAAFDVEPVLHTAPNGRKWILYAD